jgi:hypothetical protein
MVTDIRTLAQANQQVKSYSYIRNGNTLPCKPKENEAMQLFEDYLGNLSVIWIVCFDKETFRESYRFNAAHALRINFI